MSRRACRLRMTIAFRDVVALASVGLTACGVAGAVPEAASRRSGPTQLTLSAIRPGDYEGLHLKVSGDRIVGEYEAFSGLDEESGAPRFRCRFSFEVSRSARRAAVSFELGAGDRVNGWVEAVSPDAVRVWMETEPGGCWNVDPGISGHISEEGTVFELVRDRKSSPD